MKTISTGASRVWSTANKIGLALLALHGLVNLPRFLMHGPPPGQAGPPSEVLVTESLLGALAMAAAIVAWAGGSRVAARLSCAAIVLITLTALPAYFVDVSAFTKLTVTGAVLWTVVSVALTLAPHKAGATSSPPLGPGMSNDG